MYQSVYLKSEVLQKTNVMDSFKAEKENLFSVCEIFVLMNKAPVDVV